MGGQFGEFPHCTEWTQGSSITCLNVWSPQQLGWGGPGLIQQSERREAARDPSDVSHRDRSQGGDQKTRLSGALPLGVVSPRGLRGPGRYGSNRGLCCEGVGKLGALGHADAGHWGQGPRCLCGLARALH